MRLRDKRKAVMQAAEVGQKIFQDVGLIYSMSGGSIYSTSDGLTFYSTSSPSWMLYTQSTGEPQDFKMFKNLRGHKLKVEADVEWINRPSTEGKLVVSVGFYNSTNGAQAYRARYRDIIFSSVSTATHITDSFISDYDAYPNGAAGNINLDNYYFMFRIFLYAPAGSICRLKGFNVYDLGGGSNVR